MAVLDYHTAGESHGPGLVALISGLPAGLGFDVAVINAELTRRQGGYGRGGRQNIEEDSAEVLAGVRQGLTIGSPIALRVVNRDSRLDDPARTPPVHTPRPGHADLAGSVKYLTTDCRGPLERASARETTARVAAGAASRLLLRALGIEVLGIVRSIYTARTDVEVNPQTVNDVKAARDASDVYCPDTVSSALMRDAIRQAKIDRTTLGGVIEVYVFGCPPGIGGTMDWRDRLDARLAYATMGVQAIKGVELGLGFGCAARRGHEVHDPIGFDPALRDTPSLGLVRSTNHAGGTEGGMTDGAPIVVRAAMKPISTVLRGMPSIDLRSGAAAPSAYERSDICAVPAASVVLENVVAFEIARALRLKFGGDSMTEVLAQFNAYLDLARRTLAAQARG